MSVSSDTAAGAVICGGILSDTRDRNGPVLGGDLLVEGRVRGFGYQPHPSPTRSCDTLLLEGHESLPNTPARPVPRTAKDAVTLAPAPHARLAQDRVRTAADIDAGLPNAVSSLLSRPGTAWGAVATPLISTVTESGHFVWIAGGAVRDLIGGSGAQHVNDLDLAGTMPTGHFTELARKVLRALGVEHRQKVSSRRLVCSARPALGGEPLYEYRALNLADCPYPASGSDLAEDASTRDFTVNSIYYDPTSDIVVDPTGRGVADVLARPRRLFSVNRTTDPLPQAMNVLRAVKFVLRWHRTVGVDLSELAAWLPDDLVSRLADSEWDTLSTTYHEYTAGTSTALQLNAAQEVGPVATKLVVELLGRQT